MRSKEEVDAIMARRGESISLAEHSCDYTWCTGTMRRFSHHGSQDTFVTGRNSDVVKELAVGVNVVHDDTEDSRPRILLHVGSNIVDIDEDSSPTASEARRIAIHLLEAAEALDSWQGRARRGLSGLKSR